MINIVKINNHCMGWLKYWNIAQLWKKIRTLQGGFWKFHTGIMFLHY